MAAVGAFFVVVGFSITSASQFNRPNLCFFAIVCILCAHTRAAYVVIGFTTVSKMYMTNLGCGPQYLLVAPSSWHRYFLALVVVLFK